MGPLRCCAACVLLVSLAGCDREVQLTPSGGGGSGGAVSSPTVSATGPGSTSNGKATSAQGTSVATTSTGTGAPAELCGAFCGYTGCDIDLPVCLAYCQYLAHLPACTDRADAYLTCYLDNFNPPFCSPLEACDSEKNLLDGCIAAHSCVPDGGEYSATSDSCETLQDCTNGDQLELSCEGLPPDVSCTCYLNWSFIGACNQTDADCGAETGCCSQFYSP